MTGRFRVEALAPDHERARFACGNEALDKYLREQASQDIRRRTSACYVAIDEGTNIIAGYYTLAAWSVPLMDLSEDLKKKLPRYRLVPVARVGRLAVSLASGSASSARRCCGMPARVQCARGWGSSPWLFDAKDENAAAFYRHHGFVGFGSNPLAYVPPIATLAKTKERRPARS